MRSDWNPVRCISINLDDYLCCSNGILREFGLPYMQKAIDHFGQGVIHYHTPDVRLLHEVKKLKNIHVQIGNDPKLPDPVDCMDEIRRVLPDTPLTWMRIRRDDFINRLKNRKLYGNTEYLLSDVLNSDDANELYKMSQDYISPL